MNFMSITLYFYLIINMSQEQEIKECRLDVPEGQPRMSRSAQFQPLSPTFSRNQMQQQITQLKQKAHKSFLQVIQMQHLHQQEIQMIREQFDDREKETKAREQQLISKIALLETELKLTNRHILELSNSSFSIDNIDIINCKQNERSRFDTQKITQQINELVNHKDSQRDIKVKAFQNEVIRDIKVLLHLDGEQEKKLLKVLDRVFSLTNELREENQSIKQSCEELSRNNTSLETQFKSLKIQYESSQKQTRFLSDHIKRISGERFSLEKQVTELTKQKRILEESLKQLKQAKGDQGILTKVAMISEFPDNKSCVNMDMSSMSSNDLLLDELDNSRASIRTLRNTAGPRTNSPKPFRVTMENSGQQPSSNLIKNFRKKKQSGKTQLFQREI